MALFEPVFEALTAADVRFVVVGGVAVVLHGHPRLTADVDLVVDLEPASARRAVDALLDHGLRPRLPVDARDFADPEMRRRWIDQRNLEVFSFHHPDDPMLEVDLLVAPPGGDFDVLWSRAVTKALETVEVRVAAIDDLLEMKRATGRSHDRADVVALEKLRDADEGKRGRSGDG